MRSYHEGAMGSLMIAGVEMSFALAAFLPNSGSIIYQIGQRGLVEEWTLAFFFASVTTVWGVCHPRTFWRKLSFKINALVSFAAWMTLLFLIGGLATSPFGNVLLLTGTCSLVLLWMDEREDCRNLDRKRSSGHARQT